MRGAPAFISLRTAAQLADMQKDMNDLGFGKIDSEALANFDRCDGGLPCWNKTTGCANGQCARRSHTQAKGHGLVALNESHNAESGSATAPLFGGPADCGLTEVPGIVHPIDLGKAA